MTVLIAIPARLQSTRLPRKVLADIHGRPLLWHVHQHAMQSTRADGVFILTDSEEVFDAARSWGAQVLMTSPECASGTERIASVLDQLPADIILNMQGDEPQITGGALDLAIDLVVNGSVDVGTVVWPITSLAELEDPSVVKVVRSRDGRALYFSRSAIPYVRDVPQQQWLDLARFWGHVGLYAYRRAAFERYVAAPPSPLEEAEKLEQLRFLDLDVAIGTAEIATRTQAVDVAADLELVRRQMAP